MSESQVVVLLMLSGLAFGTSVLSFIFVNRAYDHILRHMASTNRTVDILTLRVRYLEERLNGKDDVS